VVGGLLATLLLAGCATNAEFSARDAGFSGVKGKTAVLAKETVWVQNSEQAERTSARVGTLLSAGKTLDAERAVQIALLNNKGLQAAYADLGDASADVWQTTMFQNPTVSIGLTGIGTPGLEAYRAIEGTLATNLLALATHGRNVDLAKVRFEQAEMNAAMKTLELAANTRRAWVNAVAATEAVSQLEQAQQAADAASELARKLGESGAMAKGGQAREHAFYAEIAGQTAQARLAARLAKEELTRLMGLWGGDTAYKLPGRLPPLPKKLIDSDVIETQALDQRLDLKVARLELKATAKSYGLTEATRFVTDLEIVSGFEAEREKDGKTKTTATKELDFAIPIFDSGKARMRKSELAYMRAANLLAEKSVNVRSEARSAYEAYRSTYDIARHYRTSVVPLRTKIEEQSLLTYNGMISNTFELLTDTRDKINAVQLSINAKRDFWLAAANLTSAVYGGGTGSSSPETASAGPAENTGAH
jgi:outer membrane protein TolC